MSADSKQQSLSRRAFVGGAAGAACMIGVPASAARTYRANEKLRIGVIGVANRGWANFEGVMGEEIRAVCDVDDSYLYSVAQQFPDAAQFRDFRKLLEMPGLDAVVVSTPDHTHAPATAAALRAGLHVYCEKPLTHTVQEARIVAELAAKHKRATQMGTQIHAEPNYRRVVELVQSGAVGAVREVHVWCGGAYSGGALPTDQPPVPVGLDWDLWLGPAQPIAYHPRFAPFVWRSWWAFGNGRLGDMACHHMDLSFWALGLRHPSTVEAQGPPVDAYSCPEWLEVRYAFPAINKRPAVELTWYDGDRRPAKLPEPYRSEWGAGTLFVGDKGMLLADYGRRILLPEKQFEGYQAPAPTIPDSVGHHQEWINACKTGSLTTCNFDYVGALTEAVLLGCAAYRAGAKLEWDAAKLAARGCPAADKLIRGAHRRGWEV